MRPVTVQYLKYPDRPHWRLDLIQLGEDEYGTWLGGPVPTVAQRGSEPPISFPTPFVQLIPRDAWWALIVNDPWYHIGVYVDIASPAVWVRPDLVTMLDLDLDIVRRQNGTVEVVDEDEFLDHQVRYGYPPDLVAKALESVALLRPEVEAGREPFGELGWQWMAKLKALAAGTTGRDVSH
jgi:hypothetical protein